MENYNHIQSLDFKMPADKLVKRRQHNHPLNAATYWIQFIFVHFLNKIVKVRHKQLFTLQTQVKSQI